MGIENQVKELIEQVISENDLRLDSVIYEKEGSNNFLRVIIDKDGYIDIDDCILVNSLIGPILEKEDPISENYILDVCSKEKGSN
ncbi:MAG: hypothetical protein PHE54_02880 [Bacilli bacterium]|nr:hypothetical protein [Bacilli bacterium]